jgi:acetyltransferase-like isoleucine patch superfamily enzyme
MKWKKLIDPMAYSSFLRGRDLRRRMKHLGNNVQFDPMSTILTPEWIEIGDNVFVGEMAHMSGRITIEDNVMFGPRPLLLGGNHLFAIRGKSVRFLHPDDNENLEPILVEREVWCGAAVVILGNVTLGTGCVIGAGSVVPKPIPPYVIAVGNPCTPIARIFDDKTLLAHLKEIGTNEETAQDILKRRKDALKQARMSQLPVIDRTAQNMNRQ